MNLKNYHLDISEVIAILISVITISLAFTLVQSNSNDFTSPVFLQTLGIIILTVGSGFVLHELAHKYVAIRYGAYARYQTWTIGLVLAVVMALTLGFVFAAPGAVYIYGQHLDRKKNGIVAAAGPATNLLLGITFLAIGASMPALKEVAVIGASVNFFLGTFNMIPIFPMDGQKVMQWNVQIWASLIAVLGILAFYAATTPL